MKHLYHRLVSSVAACSVALAPLAGSANPLGGQVVGGSATIQGQSSGQVTINQTTSRAIINWNTFNIAPGETTEFRQPDAASVTLNRVTGGTGASQIHGTINASGSVYVVNPDGILFGRTATVNVGSFLATTHDIRNDDFMAGRNSFTISGNPSASIVNQGTITAAQGGFAALVAPGVRNDGVITAKLGTVALASGNAFTLDLYGDSLIKLQASDAISAEVRDAATGQPLSNLVHNMGTIRANGGRVQLSAVTARRAVDSVINTSGVIEANTVGTQRGMIVFGAATSPTKAADAPVQRVRVSGSVQAAGKKADTRGGIIQVTGEAIEVRNAQINASGMAGGGTVLIGGDTGGSRIDHSSDHPAAAWESRSIPNATTVVVENSTIDASATRLGNGGKVVVWADDTVTYNGSLLAKGGPEGGDGGFAEVSGKINVNFAGLRADLSAPKGRPGLILFDPAILNIGQDQAVSISQILSSGTSVSEQADQINLNYNIIKAGGDATTFSLTASQINIASGVIIGSNAGPLLVQLNTVPYNISEQQNTLRSILINANNAGFTPDDLSRLIRNNAGSYNGAYYEAPLDRIVAGLAQYASPEIRNSFAFNILSRPSISIGNNVQFYTNGGEVRVTRSDGVATSFPYGIAGTPNCNSVGVTCGQVFNLEGANSATLGLRWTGVYNTQGYSVLANNAPFGFTIGGGISGLTSTNYNITRTNISDLEPLRSALPNLQISLSSLPGGIAIGTPPVAGTVSSSPVTTPIAIEATARNSLYPANQVNSDAIVSCGIKCILAVAGVAATFVELGPILGLEALSTWVERQALQEAAKDAAKGTIDGSKAEISVSDGSEALSADGVNQPIEIDDKISGQAGSKGWSADSIKETVSGPYTTRPATNRSTGNQATAYYNSDGSYVVVDNKSGNVVQISNRNDPNWKPDRSIQNPYKVH